MHQTLPSGDSLRSQTLSSGESLAMQTLPSGERLLTQNLPSGESLAMQTLPSGESLVTQTRLGAHVDHAHEQRSTIDRVALKFHRTWIILNEYTLVNYGP